MFSFWEPIYFPTGDALSYAHKTGFPSETAEQKGRFVGLGESVGDALTFKILTYAHKPGFPSETAERKGRFVGFGESVGDALTFKILTDDTAPEDFIPINASFCLI